MTAEGTMKNAIEAKKKGAFDYITKPLDLDEMEVIVEKARETLALKGELKDMKQRLMERERGGIVFVGKSKAVEKIFKTVGRAAPQDVTVLIQVESGTGKELVARLLHTNSPRGEKAFVAVNSAAVPKELMESELFDLEKAVEEKRFREDLYHRLNVVTVNIPPLRERKEDIALLCGHFLEKFSEETGAGARSLSKDAVSELQNYPWPGNVRELENILRRAVILSPNIILTPEDISLPKRKQKKESLEDMLEKKLEPFIEKTSGRGKEELYDSIMPFMERPLIKLVLKKTGFNQIKAAELLGINRHTLRKKIKELKISRKDIKD